MGDLLIRRGRCGRHRNSIARSVDKIDNNEVECNSRAYFNCLLEVNGNQCYGVVLV